MPTLLLHTSPKVPIRTLSNPLPQILQTPTGLAILEIQGTINLPQVLPSESATHAGRLDFPDYSGNDPASNTAWMKRVHLYVGQHQRLTGEVKKLPKAVAVIRKCEGIDSANEEMEVVEIVYWKVIFSSRPEPVGTSVA
jgi:chromosome transmission fidelity protein 8